MALVACTGRVERDAGGAPSGRTSGGSAGTAGNGVAASSAVAGAGGIGSGGSGGTGSTSGGGAAGGAGESTLVEGEGVGKAGMRRLTIAELDRTLEDLLGDATRPARQALQEEQLGPFENDYTKLTVSSVLVEGLERLATDVTRRLLADPARRDRVIGCSPKDATSEDSSCFRGFISEFGRRALRRPLTDAEVDVYEQAGAPFVARQGDFYAGVEVALRAMLQHPAFLYRVEVGAPVPGMPGVYRLDDWEVATRLSYLVWGSTPSDVLLERAEQSLLETPDGVRDAALEMFASPRTTENLDQFHALWLGYSVLPHSQSLTTAMRRESAMLVARAFDEDASWLDLFRATDTYVNDELAALYGLPAPAGGEGFVPYGDTGRQGLLSHGSFLSILGDTLDTSPTRRGKRVRTQLLCEDVPPPPPNVNADAPPAGTGSPCKWDRYAEHRSPSSCAGCHSQIDPIGFGLENYDREGRYRTHDIDTLDGSPTFGEELPECEITGEGEVDGLGTFRGPAELEDLLIDSNRIGPCVAKQYYRFATGRPEDADDAAAIAELQARFEGSGYAFRELVLGTVTSNAFGYRREEP